MSTTPQPAPRPGPEREQLQSLYQRRQQLFYEILELDQQLQNPNTKEDDLNSAVQRRHLLQIQHQNTLQQIALLEQKLLDPPETPLTEEQRFQKIQQNIDWEAKARFDAMQTTPSYAQHMQQVQADRMEADRVQHLSRRDKILHARGLLNPDGSLVRPLTAGEEDVLRHSLSLPDANSPDIGIAFGR
jgi:hypothetical protein